MGTDDPPRGRCSRCLVAALLSLLGSCGSQTDEEPSPAQASVTVDLPAAKSLENSAVPPQDAPPAPAPAAEAQVEPSASADNATAEVEQANELVAVSNATDENQSATEQASSPAESDPPASATAKLPLPDSVVARTIERIGYRCGRVVSTTAVAGAAPGVYKVTCSSGLSYHASPVNGRYRFRQWRS